MTPSEEEAVRRSSVADMAVVEEEGGADGDIEKVTSVRKGSSGRIYGARDWRLIGKDS